MADKQALNATFFAFRKRERGGVLMTATIAYVVLAFGMFGLFAALNWQAVADYATWAASMGENAAKADPNDPNAVFAAMMPPASVMGLGPSYFLLLLATYILLAAYEAACLRWMIHGEVKGLFGLSLGADTWRVYFTYWLWLVLLMLFYIVCAITIGGTIAGVVIAGQSGAQPSPATVLVPMLIGLAILCAVIYFSVRFAPAAATSIARRRFAFFDAWKVSRGRFWGLFGAFLLLWLMFFVFIIAIEIALVTVVGLTAMNSVGQAEPQSAEEAMRVFANPQNAAIMIGLLVVVSIVSFVFYVAMFGVNARAAALALEEGKITVG